MLDALGDPGRLGESAVVVARVEPHTRVRMRWLRAARSRTRAHRTARPTALVLLALLWPLSPGLAPRARADESDAWSAVEVGGQRVEPGETARFFVDLAQSMGGQSRMLDAFVVVTRGVKPGPSLCLTAGIHGDELNGVEVAHRIYAETSAAELSGTLIVVPAVNMAGLRSGSRYLPDRRDLNRGFPGNPNGSLASRMAYRLYQGVIQHCDALIDLHTGSASRRNLPQIRTDLESPPALALARSFGVGVVLHGAGPKGSLRRAVLDAGVPAVIYEAGEPLRFEEREIALGVQGVRNVLADLGMTKRKTRSRSAETYRKTTWVRSGDAFGVFLTSREPGDRVRKGDVLGEVTDPITEQKVAIEAPRDGRIIGMAVPQLVLPGYALFHLGYDGE
jgi:predicted deacylase